MSPLRNWIGNRRVRSLARVIAFGALLTPTTGCEYEDMVASVVRSANPGRTPPEAHANVVTGYAPSIAHG